jgi:hypothetical protein
MGVFRQSQQLLNLPKRGVPPHLVRSLLAGGRPQSSGSRSLWGAKVSVQCWVAGKSASKHARQPVIWGVRSLFLLRSRGEPSALARKASSPLHLFRPAADYHHPDCIIPRASKLRLDPTNCELPTSFLRSYVSLRSSGVIAAHPMNTNMSMKAIVM